MQMREKDQSRNFGEEPIKIESKLKKKFSMDELDELESTSPNFCSFSNIVEENFLNLEAKNSIYGLREGNFNSYNTFDNPILACKREYNSDMEGAPLTPTSFGFKESPFRFANVCIKDKYDVHTFGDVQIYLVNDLFDKEKAGLLFKCGEKEIDLRITKNQGEKLERDCELKENEVELWIQDEGRWASVKVNINLLLI